MQEKVMELGGVKVALEVPEGARMPFVTLVVQPETVEEFEAAADAVGGVDALRMPQDHGGYYATPAYASSGDGLQVAIYPPPAAVVGVSGGRQPHPFFSRYTAAG